MNKTITFIKKHYAVGLLAVASVIIVCSLARSCRLYDKLSVTEGENRILLADRDFLIAETKKLKADNASIQTQADAHIAELRSEIASNERTMESMGETLAQLENDLTANPDMPDSEVIKNLNKQIALWKGRFSIAMISSKAKDGIILDLTKKYESEKSLRITYENVIEQDDRVIIGLQSQIKLLENKSRGIRLKGKVFTYTAIILGGYIAYKNLLEKD